MARISTFVEDTLAILENAPPVAPGCPVARPGSLWVSVATRRRASVRWASGGRVRLDFTDYAHVIHTNEAFRRLYVPAL